MRRAWRRGAMWPTGVPHADAALQETAARATAKNSRVWGFVLARLRTVAGQSLAEQAASLGASESALTFLAVCRLPRPGHRDADIAAVAALVGIQAQVLSALLAGVANVAATNAS